MDREPRVRWTDERLDDRFSGLDQALQLHEKALALMGDTGIRIVALDGRLQAVAEDTADCKKGIDRLAQQLAATAKALQEQEVAQVTAKLDERAELARERVSDRRWLIGTVLTVLALIVATVGVLVATGAFT